MLTLKAPEELVAELESFARERGVTRHAAALEAVKAGIAALRSRGDTEVIPGVVSGDTETPRAVIPDAEALADLVAEKVLARLATGGDTRGDTGRRVKRAEGWLDVHRNGLELGVMAIKTAVELLTDPAGADVPGALLRLRESALFELEPYLSGAGAPRPLAGSQKPDAARSVVEGGPVPESLSGRARRAPGQAPRRPGDHQVGGLRKADPPEGSVAALVLTWRKARGLSQDAAAEAFGVARKTWGRWETGERHPEAAVVERIKAEVPT